MGKKPKKKRKKIDRPWIRRFAKSLKENLPISEQWFMAELKKRKITHHLESNVPIENRIADFLDSEYKVIIEIDGSWHDRADQKKIDKKKDKLYKMKGYTTIRIRAYDEKSLKNGIDKYYKTMNEKKLSDLEKKKTKQAKKKEHSNSKKLNKCHICKACEYETMVEYKGKSFRVCSSCKDKIIVI